MFLLPAILVAAAAVPGCRQAESKPVEPAATHAGSVAAEERDKRKATVPSDLDLETLRVLKACRDAWRADADVTSP